MPPVPVTSAMPAAPPVPAAPGPARAGSPPRAWSAPSRQSAGGAQCSISTPRVLGVVEGRDHTREPQVVVGPQIALALYRDAADALTAVPLDPSGAAAGPAVVVTSERTTDLVSVAVGQRVLVALQVVAPQSRRGMLLVVDEAGRLVGVPTEVAVGASNFDFRALTASGTGALLLVEVESLPRLFRLELRPDGSVSQELIIGRPNGFERMFRTDPDDVLSTLLYLAEDEQGAVVLTQVQSERIGQDTALVFPPGRAVLLGRVPDDALARGVALRGGSIVAGFSQVRGGFRTLTTSREGVAAGPLAPAPPASPNDRVVGRFQPNRDAIHLARHDEIGQVLPDVLVAPASGAPASGGVAYAEAAWDGAAFLFAYESCVGTRCEIRSVRASCPSN